MPQDMHGLALTAASAQAAAAFDQAVIGLAKFRIDATASLKRRWRWTPRWRWRTCCAAVSP